MFLLSTPLPFYDSCASQDLLRHAFQQFSVIIGVYLANFCCTYLWHKLAVYCASCGLLCLLSNIQYVACVIYVGNKTVQAV
jgi:hypothetical protein